MLRPETMQKHILFSMSRLWPHVVGLLGNELKNKTSVPGIKVQVNRNEDTALIDLRCFCLIVSKMYYL